MYNLVFQDVSKRNWLRDKNNKTILPKTIISQNKGHSTGYSPIAAKDKIITKKYYKISIVSTFLSVACVRV